MLEKIPDQKELIAIMGEELYQVWKKIEEFMLDHYEMEVLWNGKSKGGLYECKYRKSGKTLCSLYVREKSFGCMVIYGKTEREKFEEQKEIFSTQIQKLYEEAQTFYDGKWIMVEVKKDILLEDIKKMILIKKKPNKKR